MTHTWHSTTQASAVATTRQYGMTIRLFLDTDPTEDLTGVSANPEGKVTPLSAESIDDIAASALIQGF